jgi:hypothetical protein
LILTTPFKLLSAEFQQPDYKDYHSHQNKIIKRVAMSIFLYSKIEATQDDEDTMDKTELYVLATLNTIKSASRRF